ncbi:MAG: hypothetical protein LCH46_04970 [Proteobacteria bacterium]|nr:hypothetical protein [Pseudomonadota bacterium]
MVVDYHLAWLLAIVVGIVSSGVVASSWRLATDEELALRDLFDPLPSLMTPFRVAAIIISAPVIVLADAFWWLIERPLVGLPILAAGLVWSFMQGVFILSHVFGL